MKNNYLKIKELFGNWLKPAGLAQIGKLEIGNSRSKTFGRAGFTLIEVMVAISIFAIVMTMGTAAVLNTSAVYRKATATRALLDNLSFVMEDMSRNLRLGEKFTCPFNLLPVGQNCIVDEMSISFKNVNGVATGYSIDETDSANNTGVISKYDPNLLVPGFVQISSPEFKIDILKSGFTVSGVDIPGSPPTIMPGQPMVTIRLSGYIEIKGEKTEFNLQTTVSQREPE